MITENNANCNIFHDPDGIRRCRLQSGNTVHSQFVHKGSNWYYFDKNGKMLVSEFLRLGGQTYYFDQDGHRAAGWTEIDGKTYYFSTITGIMATGMTYIDGKSFDLGRDGVLRSKYHEAFA